MSMRIATLSPTARCSSAFDELRQADDARVQRLAPREGEQLGGQFLAPFDGVEDVQKALAAVVVAAQHQLDVGADDVQDVVEVVRHAARQLADGLQLLRAQQRGPRFLQPLLALLLALRRLLARTDVAHERRDAVALPGRQRRDRDFHRDRMAVARQRRRFRGTRQHRAGAVLREVRQAVAPLLALRCGDQEVEHVVPHRLVLAPAEQLAGLQVPVRDAAVGRDRDEGVVCGLQDQAHAFAFGVDAVARGAQLHRHPLRQLQRAAALGGQQPHDERQQDAQADARERDRERRAAVERRFEVRRRVDDDGPCAAGAVDRRLVAQQGLAAGRAAGRPVEQGVRGGREAIVDLDQQVARVLAAQAAHQVVHAERRIHPADDGGAPGRDRVVLEA
jgi:hypothetical protein